MDAIVNQKLAEIEAQVLREREEEDRAGEMKAEHNMQQDEKSI